MAAAGLLLTGLLIIFKPRAIRYSFDRVPFFAAYACVAVAGVQTLTYVAITRLQVGIVLLLQFMSPVMVVFWVRYVHRIRLPRRAFIGAVVAVIGLGIVVDAWEGRITLDALGLLLGLLSGVCSAGFFLMSDSFRDDVDALGLISWGMLGSTVILFPFARPWKIPWNAFRMNVVLNNRNLPAWGAYLWLVIVATIIAYIAGIAAVRRLSPAISATVSSVEVIAGAVIAWLLLGQKLGISKIAGGVIVILGALLAQSATSRLPPRSRTSPVDAVAITSDRN